MVSLLCCFVRCHCEKNEVCLLTRHLCKMTLSRDAGCFFPACDVYVQLIRAVSADVIAALRFAVLDIAYLPAVMCLYFATINIAVVNNLLYACRIWLQVPPLG